MAEPFGTTLVLLQILIYLAIASRLMLFNSEGRTHRPWVSRLAFLLAGSSAACAMHLLITLPLQASLPSSPWQTLFIAIVMVGIFKARGNLAYFLPR